MRTRMNAAVNRAQAAVDAARRELRACVRSHLARALRLDASASTAAAAEAEVAAAAAELEERLAASGDQAARNREPGGQGGRGGTAADLPAAPPSPATPPPHVPTVPASGPVSQLAPTPWADRHGREPSDASAASAASGFGGSPPPHRRHSSAQGPGWAAGGAPDAAKPAPVPPPFRSRARSAAAASTSGAGAAAINHGSAAAAAADASLGASVASFLDHSLGASLAKFALVFGKLHPVREQGASAVVRWPVPVKRRPAGAAGGEGWFTRGWGSSPGRGKTGDEVVIPPTPARPPCLYAPHQCPWGHEAFADDEALFERRPPPESVAFALAFQDLRTFAWLLGLEIAQWYPEVVPPVPPARAELPEGTSLDEAQARQYDAARSRAFREAQEWREFVFECSLDAASILCYEPCLNLCMDRWGDRDNTLMQ